MFIAEHTQTQKYSRCGCFIQFYRILYPWLFCYLAFPVSSLKMLGDHSIFSQSSVVKLLIFEKFFHHLKVFA
jgi:hypothetical protein